MRPSILSLLLPAVISLGLFLSNAARCEPLDGRLLELIPPDTSQLSGFDVAALRQTDLYRRWEEALGDKSADMWGDLVGKTGIDPRTELTSIVLAGSIAIESRGLNVYRFPEHQLADADEQIKFPIYAMTFIDDSTIVAGGVDHIIV